MTVISSSPTAKLRLLTMRSCTIGASVVSSRTTKPARPSTAITASQRIVTLANQSASWPLSSRICSAARPTAMSPKPR